MNQSKRKQMTLNYTRRWKGAKKTLNLAEEDLQIPDPPIIDETCSLGHSSDHQAENSSDHNDGNTENENEGPVWGAIHSGEAISSDSENDIADLWNIIDQHEDISSDSNNEDDGGTSLAEELKEWVGEFLIKQNALDKLLKILKGHGHDYLPVTARTLLKTPKTVHIDNKSGMEYIYLGLKEQLVKYLFKYPIADQTNTLEISLNIDGLPIFKSSNKAIWPILCAIHLQPISVFPIALTYGESKPSNLDFLHDTVRDLEDVLQNGLLCNDEVLEIQLRCIDCDAPAKAMIKAIKLYSGYNGCDRCNQKGEWFGRMTYQDVDNLTIRTDESFRNQSQGDHHRGYSPFCDASIDMITKFPVDYMHQACLGVTKKLILLWLRGKKEVRISATQADEISRRLRALQGFIPSCFARKPRGLNDIDRWKATEYRQFLFYTGKLVLKGILRKDFYDHFLSLSVALSILVSSSLAQEATNREYAEGLLKYFVEKGRCLYGPEFMVYNVHSMLHIGSDVAEYGSLDRFSAFPFENYLQQLKKLVRSGKNPLAQIIRRLGEHADQDVKHEGQHANKVSSKKPSNAFITDNSLCCEVISVSNEERGERAQYMCRVYNQCEPFFMEPCDSRLVGVYSVVNRNTRIQFFSRHSLKTNAIMIDQDDDNKSIFMAILHEF